MNVSPKITDPYSLKAYPSSQVSKRNIFFHRSQLNFTSNLFKIIGLTMTISGLSIMNYSRKIRSITYGALFIFSGGFITTLFGLTFLYAGNSGTEKSIEHYEQSGDFATALKIARQHHEKLLKLGLSEEARIFADRAESLEKKILSLGSLNLLFDENYRPRAKLIQLLELVGMEPLNDSENAIVQINNWAQKNLLRQGERWEEQTNRFEELKLKIKPLLKELGFVDATLPHFKEYQGAIVHGALLPRVRLRLYYLIEQWKKGVRFPQLYFLSSDRPLETQQENRSCLTDDKESLLKIRKDWIEPLEFPKTECEMIQLIWEQSEIPNDMRQEVEVHFIHAPMKKDSNSQKLIRPSTDDSVKTWLNEMPQPSYGRYLAITNAPYTHRQDWIVKAIAPNEYSFDTIGPGASDQEKIAIFLDELARFIFQVKQTKENKR